MAYRESKIGLTARTDPERAARELLDAYERAGADPEFAASALGISRRTLDRLVRSLGIVEQVAEARARLRPPAA